MDLASKNPGHRMADEISSHQNRTGPSVHQHPLMCKPSQEMTGQDRERVCRNLLWEFIATKRMSGSSGTP